MAGTRALRIQAEYNEETVVVEQLSDSAFRVAECPWSFVDFFGFDDVIELSVGGPNLVGANTASFTRLLQNTPLRRDHYKLNPKVMPDDIGRLVDTIEAMGGYCEVAGGSVLFVALPRGRKFDVDAELHELLEGHFADLWERAHADDEPDEGLDSATTAALTRGEPGIAEYPSPVIDRIIADLGDHPDDEEPDVLDAGCLLAAAGQFKAAGCGVLRLATSELTAGLARMDGLGAEVAPLARWDPAGRSFDAVVSGWNWQWLDAAATAAAAATALKAGGQLTVLWNVYHPPLGLLDEFAEVHRKVMLGGEADTWARLVLGRYSAQFFEVAEGIRQVGSFGELSQWQVDWERSFSPAEWREVLPTHSPYSQLAPAQLEKLVNGVDGIVEVFGDGVTMRYTTVAITAERLL